MVVEKRKSTNVVMDSDENDRRQLDEVKTYVNYVMVVALVIGNCQ